MCIWRYCKKESSCPYLKIKWSIALSMRYPCMQNSRVCKANPLVPPCICATSSSPHFYPRTPHCTKAKAKAYSHSLTIHASHLLTVATMFPGAHGYSCSNRRSTVSSLNKLMPFQENSKAGEYQCQSYQRLPLIHNYHSQTSFPLSRYHYDVKEFGQSSSTEESTSPVCDGKTW